MHWGTFSLFCFILACVTCGIAAISLVLEGATIFKLWKQKGVFLTVHLVIFACMLFMIVTEGMQARGQFIMQEIRNAADLISPESIDLHLVLPAVDYNLSLYQAGATSYISTRNVSSAEEVAINSTSATIDTLAYQVGVVKAAVARLTAYEKSANGRSWASSYKEALNWDIVYTSVNTTSPEVAQFDTSAKLLAFGRSTTYSAAAMLIRFAKLSAQLSALGPILSTGGHNLNALYGFRTATSICYGIAVLDRFKLFRAIANIPRFVFPTLYVCLFLCEAIGSTSIYITTNSSIPYVNLPYLYHILLDLVASSAALRKLLNLAKDLNAVVLNVSRTRLIAYYVVLMFFLIVALVMTVVQNLRPGNESSEWAILRDVPFMLGFLLSFRFVFLFKAVASDTAKGGNLRNITVGDTSGTYATTTGTVELGEFRSEADSEKAVVSPALYLEPSQSDMPRKRMSQAADSAREKTVLGSTCEY
ncbi:hypothetical protein DFS34DRAFT_144733 [Phlyctochytrium arcticum]|nr:hypothetical protein DFS34DRAFT_144733 [Phlyctochytrium arcticum]